MKYNITLMCRDLGILQGSDCDQKFEKQIEGSEGVPEELAIEMKLRIVEHYKISHPEFKDKIDNLDLVYLKDIIKNKSTYKEVN